MELIQYGRRIGKKVYCAIRWIELYPVIVLSVSWTTDAWRHRFSLDFVRFPQIKENERKTKKITQYFTRQLNRNLEISKLLKY